jgi:hypothetical protein
VRVAAVDAQEAEAELERRAAAEEQAETLRRAAAKEQRAAVKAEALERLVGGRPSTSRSTSRRSARSAR